MPVSLGRQHTSKAAAHRSYSKVFYVLSIGSFLLYWRLFVSNIYSNTPSEPSHIWDIISNSASKESTKTNRLLSGISVTGQKLKYISKHPAISVTSLDVLFTTISLLTWTFTRNLDVDALLENSVLSFLAPKHEKHVAFEDQLAKVQESLPEPLAAEPVTPRKRGPGRPSKKAATVNGTSAAPASSTGSVRRSSRKKTRSVDLDSDAHSANYESDADSTYQPSEKTKRAIAETEADGATTAGDLAHAGESTALALFLTFAGGLGQLAAGALGAEVSGP